MDLKKTINVHVPANLNLEQSNQVLAAVLKKAGHTGCISGLNINFVNAIDPSPLRLNVEPGSLKVTEVGG